MALLVDEERLRKHLFNLAREYASCKDEVIWEQVEEIIEDCKKKLDK